MWGICFLILEYWFEDVNGTVTLTGKHKQHKVELLKFSNANEDEKTVHICRSSKNCSKYSQGLETLLGQRDPTTFQLLIFSLCEQLKPNVYATNHGVSRWTKTPLIEMTEQTNLLENVNVVYNLKDISKNETRLLNCK